MTELIDGLAEILDDDGIIVVPTDTVYGVAARVSADGVAALFEAKDRPEHQPIAVLIGDPEQVGDIAPVVPEAAQALMDAHWPGALTVIVDADPTIAELVGAADGTVGIRCPDAALVRALSRRVGPLAVTSANRSGEPTPANAADAAASLTRCDAVVDQGPLDGVPSTVVKVSAGGDLDVIRQGGVDLAPPTSAPEMSARERGDVASVARVSAMRIAVGSDHAGFQLKSDLVAHLESAGHEVVDLGTDSTERVDYPDFGAAVGRAVAGGDADYGLCVCGSGIGIAMAANKIAGIRAATVTDVTAAHLTREHNNANVICFGERLIGPEVAKEALDAFLAAEFEGGRHAGRVAKIDAL